MKRLSTMASLLAAILAFSLPAAAQTADGQTPAEETICTPLKASGVTPGLFGLCVAFCEAQDIASPNNPITQEELDALEAQNPAGSVLKNYNKRKTATDPAMPCIKIEEPCPCWKTGFLAIYDGVGSSGQSVGLKCSGDGVDSRRISEDGADKFGRPEVAFANVTPSPRCGRIRAGVGSALAITANQARSCVAQINAQCTYMGQ